LNLESNERLLTCLYLPMRGQLLVLLVQLGLAQEVE
jgi:hypothetical protein